MLISALISVLFEVFIILLFLMNWLLIVEAGNDNTGHGDQAIRRVDHQNVTKIENPPFIEFTEVRQKELEMKWKMLTACLQINADEKKVKLLWNT